MRQFSTADLVKHIGDVTHAAAQEPVAITQHRKARFVMMTMENYEAMRRDNDPRRAFGSGDLPEDESAAVVAEIERSIADLESRGGE
jgi:PHD/YefM family antitoxin component YafN of YafNO toxin-antitoxin module